MTNILKIKKIKKINLNDITSFLMKKFKLVNLELKKEYKKIDIG